MQAIDSIKIVQVDGLRSGGEGTTMRVPTGGGSGNLASDAVSAALAYRAQAPVIDGLMKELGLDGSSLDNLVKGGGEAGGLAAPAAQKPAPAKPEAPKTAAPAEDGAKAD